MRALRTARAAGPADDARRMVDPDEWRWIEEHARGDFDHLLLGTSLPFLLAPGGDSLHLCRSTSV